MPQEEWEGVAGRRGEGSVRGGQYGGVTVKLQLCLCGRPGTAEHSQQRSEMGQDCRCRLSAALSWLFLPAGPWLQGAVPLKLWGRNSFRGGKWWQWLWVGDLSRAVPSALTLAMLNVLSTARENSVPNPKTKPSAFTADGERQTLSYWWNLGAKVFEDNRPLLWATKL